MRLIERASENEAKRNLVGIEKQIATGVYILVHDLVICEISALVAQKAHKKNKNVIFEANSKIVNKLRQECTYWYMT